MGPWYTEEEYVAVEQNSNEINKEHNRRHMQQITQPFSTISTIIIIKCYIERSKADWILVGKVKKL